MLVLHVCKSCCLYLQAKRGGPYCDRYGGQRFQPLISISIKYTYWTDNVWSRDTNTLLQHNQPEMNCDISHLTYFLMATETSRILSTISQAKTCHMLQHSAFFPHHLWMNTPDGCLYLTYFEEYGCNALQHMAYKVWIFIIHYYNIQYMVLFFFLNLRLLGKIGDDQCWHLVAELANCITCHDTGLM